jgi:hypothetical protein
MEALLAELKDDSVRQFVKQRFSWDGWYDALPTMPIYVAFAKLSGEDFETSVREATRMAAHDLVPRVFRYFMQLSGPAALTARVPQVVMHAVDFVRVTLERTREDSLVGTGAGIPAIIAPNIANLVLGFFEGALELGGTKDIVARYTDVARDGERDGFETLAVRYEFKWTPRHKRT